MTTDSSKQHSTPTGSAGADALLLKIVELLGAIVAPVTVLSALLYYFGWVRERAVLGYFGADPAILRFGLPEYVARSAGPAFKPIVIVLLVSALAILIGRAVNVAEQRWRGVTVVVRGRRLTLRRPSASLLLLCGLVSMLTGAAVAVGLATYPPTWAALALACGSLAVWHGARHLASTPDSLRSFTHAELALLFGLIATALFWATAAYAQQGGERLARFIDQRPERQAAVTIHSADNLNLWTEPGTPPGQGKFPHTYRGLRLLIYANEQWLLLTDERTSSGRHRLVIVRDNDSIRVEVSA